ncbi:MAG TPA: hypothetical protein VK986_04110 [Tepidisphaeraceae bacterium]|nr:hypothetical protein [Tepidisphaeraceae bacterium]
MRTRGELRRARRWPTCPCGFALVWLAGCVQVVGPKDLTVVLDGVGGDGAGAVHVEMVHKAGSLSDGAPGRPERVEGREVVGIDSGAPVLRTAACLHTLWPGWTFSVDWTWESPRWTIYRPGYVIVTLYPMEAIVNLESESVLDASIGWPSFGRMQPGAVMGQPYARSAQRATIRLPMRRLAPRRILTEWNAWGPPPGELPPGLFEGDVANFSEQVAGLLRTAREHPPAPAVARVVWRAVEEQWRAIEGAGLGAGLGAADRANLAALRAALGQ